MDLRYNVTTVPLDSLSAGVVVLVLRLHKQKQRRLRSLLFTAENVSDRPLGNSFMRSAFDARYTFYSYNKVSIFYGYSTKLETDWSL